MRCNGIRSLQHRAAKSRFFSTENKHLSVGNILRDVQEGKLTVNKAESFLLSLSDNKGSPQPDSLHSFANLDHTRSKRTGFPEAVFGSGKTPEQVARILDDMARHLNEELKQGDAIESQHAILATRFVVNCCLLNE